MQLSVSICHILNLYYDHSNATKEAFMANYVPSMSKEDLLELREILKRTIKNAEEKGDGESIGLVGTYAELEEVEDRLKELA